MWHMIRTTISVIVAGRAGGKTDGISADAALFNVHEMPRGNGAIYCNTYTSILQIVLPGMIRGWKRYGYHEGVHFWVRKYAPKEYDLRKAYRYPLTAEHYIHWYNGSGIFLVSGDRSTSNGFDLDWAIVEEARLQNRDRLREFLLTIRGNDRYFGHLSSHGSVLYVTDMPQNSREKWVLDFRDQMDPEIIQGILACTMKIQKIRDKMRGKAESTKERLTREMKEIEALRTELRRKTVYFSKFTTLDNVHALGKNVIENFKRNLTDLEYQISVLAEEDIRVQNGFYSLLNKDQHVYLAENYDVIDKVAGNRIMERDCTWQTDISPHSPLYIAFDHNQVINNVVTAQIHGEYMRFVSHHHTMDKDNEYLAALVRKWCLYYRAHINKTVYYYYDNTSIAGDARGSIPFNKEIIDILREHGWVVHDIYIGQSPTHHSRHHLWTLAFLGTDERVNKVLFNEQTCEWLLKSFAGTPMKRIGAVYKKDKSNEKPDSKGRYQTDQREAVHASEAADIVFWGTQRDKVDGLPEYEGHVIAK